MPVKKYRSRQTDSRKGLIKFFYYVDEPNCAFTKRGIRKKYRPKYVNMGLL